MFPFTFQKLVEEPEIAVADDGLFILGEKSFAKHVEKGSHFIKFYAPWCGHCKVCSLKYMQHWVRDERGSVPLSLEKL